MLRKAKSGYRRAKSAAQANVEELNNANSSENIRRAYQLRNIENQQFGVTSSRTLSNSRITQTADIHTVAELFEVVMQKEKTFNVAFDHKLYALGKTNDSVALYRITVEEQFHDEKHPNNMMFHNLKYIKKIADVPAGAIEEKTTIAYQQWSHQLPQV